MKGVPVEPDGAGAIGDDLELLWTLADQADTVTSAAFWRGETEFRTKADGSPVTAIDIAVEQQLRQSVRAAFADDGFVGEELGTAVGRSGRRWIVDGIDGTVAFARGRPEWSTLVAIVEGASATAGIATSPALHRRWVGRSDGAALRYTSPRTRPHRLQVSDVSVLASDRVAHWPPASELSTPMRELAMRLGDATADATRRASWDNDVPHGAVLVAEGRLDGFVLFGGGPWDHAAPQALVESAGGVFTDLTGERTVFGTGGVYSNGHIHERVLALIR